MADIILRAAYLHPDAGLNLVAGIADSEAEYLSYPDLLKDAQEILGGLRQEVDGSGAKIALLLERAGDFIPAFWACILGGHVPCPLVPIRNDSARWAKYLAHVDALLEHPLFVSTRALREELPASVASAAIEDLRNGIQCEEVHRASWADPAIFVLTSGSTGDSKAVVLTHGNLMSSMSGKTERQKLDSADVTFNWISFDHVAALLEAHLLPLYVGATQVHANPSAILAEPLSFLRLINRFRVSMSFTPNFLLGQINAVLQSTVSKELSSSGPAFDLSCLRHIVSGGEAIVVETGRRFLELLAPYGLARNSLWPAFGMTETCAGSVYSREFPDGDVGREFACLGEPIIGLKMRVADERGIPQTGTQPGELQLWGPMIFSHYHNNQGATSAAFTPDGWFRSGDLARIEDGRLHLVGRTKDSIIVSGVNYFSHELEAFLEQLEGIDPSFVAAFPTRPTGTDTEQLVVAFASTLPVDDEERLYQLVVAVRSTTILLWGFRPAMIVPLPRSAFPKTSLGKIQRSLMRRRLESGEYAGHVVNVTALMGRHLGPYVPPEGPIESEITELFSATFGVQSTALSAMSSFFDLGGTSLDILRLTQTLERRFSLVSALPMVLRAPTVRKLAGLIATGTCVDSSRYDPIIPLQATGKKPPLFCVHPGNGEVLVFLNLAKYFVNERPFHALRPRGFNQGEPCFETFEEIVSTYCDAIRERQPHGPYALAGYSMGGPIAFEIAKMLERSGERVAFLGCIDGYPCRREAPLDVIDVATSLGFILELIDLPKAGGLSAQLRATPSAVDPCECVIQAASRDRLRELELDLRKFAAWVRVAHSVQALGRRHATAGRVTAMTVFCSTGHPLSVPIAQWHGWLRQWDEFVLRPKYVHVPGDHVTLMAPKHVAEFQALLRTELDLAFAST